MAKELTWKQAIDQVLGAAAEALHYKDITEQIISDGLRSGLGTTPGATVNALISASIKKLGDESPYVRVARGTFALSGAPASACKNEAPAPSNRGEPEENDKQEKKLLTPTEFEECVARLLRLVGYTVKGEHILGHKKIDLYAEELRLGVVRRIAVECKYDERRLSQAMITAIYANYLPLYRDNLVDEILVVTRSGLAPSACTMVNTTRELTHIEFGELQCSLMDFSVYLQGLVRQHEETGQLSYYVPTRMSEPETKLLSDYIDGWIEPGEESPPLAVLGSYGMGKTTFAEHTSYVMAMRAIRNAAARIPILIRLGDISTEQSLEGLLGKTFTSNHIVRNYNFEIFMALNALGRFVVFLDGFDEMKHTLSWDEFRYNFKELNRLVTAESRVVLLGRPTAFLSDDEHQRVLHGRIQTRVSGFREPDWPDYREIRLAPFTRSDIELFVTIQVLETQESRFLARVSGL